MNDGEEDIAFSQKMARIFDWLAQDRSFFNAIGLTPMSLQPGHSVYRAEMTEKFSTASGAIHGGILTALADSVLGLTVMGALEKPRPIATVSLSTEYLGEVRPGAYLQCSAKNLIFRDDIAHLDAETTIEASGELVTKSRAAFMIGTKLKRKESRL